MTRRRFLAWLLALPLAAPAARALGMGDGAWDDSDVVLTRASTWVRGDVTGGPFRLLDTVSGGGLFTTNSDPDVVGVDPLTGLDAPAGTDVGFAASVRRFLLTGIYNGDLATPPRTTGDPVETANRLPYWSNGTSGAPSVSALWEASAATASGARLTFALAASGAADERYLEAMVPVSGHPTASYELVPSLTVQAWAAGTAFVRRQYLTASQAVTGSEAEATIAAVGTVTITPGTVPTDAYWMRVRWGARGTGTGALSVSDVRLVRTIGALGKQELTASGTWTKPSDATWVEVTIVGGGGGGGGGRRGAAGSARSGGGGGGGGAMSTALYRASDLASTVTVTIGAGGTGGAGVSTDNTSGNPGTAGGSSTFGAHLVAAGGAAGTGGTAAAGTAGTGGAGMFTGNAGGDGGGAIGAGGFANVAYGGTAGAGGGGGGGGIPGADTTHAGGGGGVPIQVSSVVTGGAAGAAGAAGSAGAAVTGATFGGTGGGGGGSGGGGANGRGGAGARGGGGGGGGAVANGTAGSGGGDGGAGYAAIVAW